MSHLILRFSDRDSGQKWDMRRICRDSLYPPSDISSSSNRKKRRKKIKLRVHRVKEQTTNKYETKRKHLLKLTC